MGSNEKIPFASIGKGMRPAAAAGRLPLHVEISEMLARDIQAGLLSDGERLAPERDLAAKLGVSVGTLRKALLDLTEKGLLERIQGSGNYVRSAHISNDDAAPTIYRFFRLELIAGGGLPTAEIVSVNRMRKPAELPDIGPSADACCIRRLRRLNKQDAALEEIWIDAPRNRDIKAEELSDSLYLFYRDQLAIWIVRAEDSVGVSPLPDWRPPDFGADVSDRKTIDVWGHVERRSFDRTAKCVEFSRTWFNPATTRFVARWK